VNIHGFMKVEVSEEGVSLVDDFEKTRAGSDRHLPIWLKVPKLSKNDDFVQVSFSNSEYEIIEVADLREESAAGTFQVVLKRRQP